MVDWLLWQESNAKCEEKFSAGEDTLPPVIARLIANPPQTVRMRVKIVLNMQPQSKKKHRVCGQVQANVPKCRKHCEGYERFPVNVGTAVNSWCRQHVGRTTGNVATSEHFYDANSEWHKYKVVKCQNFVYVHVHGLSELLPSGGAYFLSEYTNGIVDKAQQYPENSVTL